MSANNTESSDRDDGNSDSREKEQPSKDDDAGFLKVMLVIALCFLVAALVTLVIFYVDILKLGRTTMSILIRGGKHEDTYSPVHPINYTLDLDIDDTETFEGLVSVAFTVETETNYLALRTGFDLLIISAEINGQGNLGISKDGNMTYLDLVFSINPGIPYMLTVSYAGQTTKTAGAGLYSMNVGHDVPVFFSLRGLTKIDHIVPVFDRHKTEAVWFVKVTVPADRLVYSTAPLQETTVPNEKYKITKIFAPTSPMAAADLVLVIGSSKSIQIRDVANADTSVINKNGLPIHVYLIELNGGYVQSESFLANDFKSYFEQYPFYDFEQIGFLVFERSSLPDDNVLADNYFIGGNLIASSFEEGRDNIRLFARLLFGNHLYANSPVDQAVLYALADYTTHLVFDGPSTYLDHNMEKIRLRAIAEADGKINDDNFLDPQNRRMAVLSQEKKYKTDKVITGLHALAQLVGLENFQNYLRAYVAAAPVNTHFTTDQLGKVVQMPANDVITCDNDTSTPFQVAKYFSHIVSNYKYIQVEAILQPGGDVVLKQDPFDGGAVPLFLQDSVGNSKPFVLCSSQYVLSTPGVCVKSLHGFYQLSDGIAVPEPSLQNTNDESVARRRKRESSDNQDVMNVQEMSRRLNRCKKLYFGNPNLISICIRKFEKKYGMPYNEPDENIHKIANMIRNNPIAYKNLENAVHILRDLNIDQIANARIGMRAAVDALRRADAAGK